LNVTVEDQIAEDDKVVTPWKVIGTPQIEFAGADIKPNGKPVTITAIHIHRVQNGKLIEHWEGYQSACSKTRSTVLKKE